MKKRKEDIIFIAVLLGLLLMFLVYRAFKTKNAEAPVLMDDVPIDQVLPELKAVKKPTITIIKKEKPAIVWPELSYTQEFAKYKDGRLIQFDMNCGVFNSTLVIANGSSMMIDNRSNKEQIITIGDKRFYLTPYGFQAFGIQAPELPTTYLIDCNDRQNVATLIVE